MHNCKFLSSTSKLERGLEESVLGKNLLSLALRRRTFAKIVQEKKKKKSFHDIGLRHTHCSKKLSIGHQTSGLGPSNKLSQ